MVATTERREQSYQEQRLAPIPQGDASASVFSRTDQSYDTWSASDTGAPLPVVSPVQRPHTNILNKPPLHPTVGFSGVNPSLDSTEVPAPPSTILEPVRRKKVSINRTNTRSILENKEEDLRDHDMEGHYRISVENGNNPTQQWDSSDGKQFRLLEIERMRNKTQRLRQQNQTTTPDRHQNHTPFATGSFDPHAGLELPLSNSFQSGDGSQSTKSSSFGQSVRRKKSSGRIWSSSPNPWDNESSLGEILDESSATSSLQKSFKLPRRRRSTSLTPSSESFNPATTDTDEDRTPSVATPSNATTLYPTKVSPESPSKVSVAPSDAPTEEVASHDERDDGISPNNTQQTDPEEADFSLHDLCGEASSTDDIAWRNALCLVSEQPKLALVCDTNDSDEGELDGQGWAPLHIACLGIQPPPTYMTRALLYANPEATRWKDDGGRLPLHLLAASSADIRTMELLLECFPQAIYKLDSKGLTPLHLLLRNTSVPLTVQNVSLLLGLSNPNKSNNREQMQKQQERFILHRRKQHLEMTLEDMDNYLKKMHRPTVTRLHPDHDSNDEEFDLFPPDVQVALRKLAKWRKQQSDDEQVNRREDLVDDDEGWSETNPAAIPHQLDLKLPIHMAVARGIVQRTPLDDDLDSDESFDDEEDEMRDLEVGTHDRVSNRASLWSSVEDVYNVLRCIISAFPEALCVRDAEGLTPLLHVMTMTDGLPNQDLIELLLGKRLGAFEEIPSWLTDIPLHSITTLPASHNRFLCPAMVASARTYQLPLHIAAEEFLSDFSIVETIYKSYPAAVDVQDYRGRTPLHLVFSNYRLFPADPRVIALLLSDASARMVDVEGNLPFDMLVESAEYVPKTLPSSWEADEMALAYQKFFTASLMASTMDGRHPNTKQFLLQLRQLPPWIRRQACSVSYVQSMVIEELSSPWRTACILMDGMLLVATLVFFRLEVDDFTQRVEIRNERFSPSEILTSVIFMLIVVRSLILCFKAILAANIHQLSYLVLLNGWFWVDAGAMALTGASIFLMHVLPDHSVLSMATGATGLLWLSLLGFCATWSYGMALLLGSLSKIANQIVWPVFSLAMVLVAFAQMFQTLLWSNCDNAIPSTTACSLRDSYRIVFMLLRGESLVDSSGEQTMSTEAIILVAAFLLLLFLLSLAVLVAVIIGALHTNTEEVAFRSFWEPKLAFVLSYTDWGYDEQKKSLTLTTQQGFQRKMELLWDLLLSSISFGMRSPRRNEHNWFSGHRARGSAMAIPLWFVSLVAIPLWFFLGLLTFGLLWPPQLRRLLFRPLGWENKKRSLSTASEQAASGLSEVRSELVRVKTMSYERSIQVEREVRDVKQLLHAAVHGD